MGEESGRDKPVGIGTVGMLLNLATTLIVSRLTPPSPEEIREMVENVRVPREVGAALDV